MKENELYLVKEFKFDSPIFTEIDSIIDNCFKDCHKIYFHKCKYKSIYDNTLTNITNFETISLTISGKSMISCVLLK